MIEPVPVIVKLTVLGYELNSIQNAYINYLIPAIFGCVFYIVHFATDLALVYRHYCEDDSIWGGLTLFFMFLPVIGCYMMTVSSWEMWPEMEGCGAVNIKWFILKTLQHLFFPIWSMWRYSEKIFWSIEGILCKDEESRDEALNNSTAPRTIEFYFFLKGFLHAIPQILLQMHILVRYFDKVKKETLDIQVASILMNIAILAATTVLYQRFKTQKLGGKNYPWFKPYKYPYQYNADVVDSHIPVSVRKVGIIYCTRDSYSKSRALLLPEEDKISNTSSEYYEQPITASQDIIHGMLDDSKIEVQDEVDFPKSIRLITSLPEDDIAGKLIAFCWWYCFLIARFLAITTFAYFFPTDIIWLLSSHFILCVSFLLYDVQAYVVRQTKALFFIFIGFIYLFCIIEFKKKFKKAAFIYNGYFGLVFLENFVMCSIWFSSQLEDIHDDWWFRYSFYITLLFTILSFGSMLFYNIINRGRKVVVAKEVVDSINI